MTTTTADELQEALRKLDRDYYGKLLVEEKSLLDALDSLQKEEQSLRQAIAADTADTTTQQRRQILQAQAEERLKNALLLAESSSSSDEESQPVTTT